MAITVSEVADTPRQRASPALLAPAPSRAFFAGIVLAALLAGWFATGAAAEAEAVARAGTELTRLLRAMAALKAIMALAPGAAIFWRLGSAVPLPWLGLYALAAAAMAAAPGLIWGMAHVGWGALLLHGGLFAALLLLWRDPAVGSRLEALTAARRTALRRG